MVHFITGSDGNTYVVQHSVPELITQSGDKIKAAFDLEMANPMTHKDARGVKAVEIHSPVLLNAVFRDSSARKIAVYKVCVFTCSQERSKTGEQREARAREILVEKEKLNKELMELEDTSPLSPDEKKIVDEDFKEWSGGFAPNETTQSERTVYVDHSCPLILRKTAVCTYLRSCE
jgi:hypothetical protein